MKLFLAKCNNAEGHKNSYYVNFNTHTLTITDEILLKEDH